MQNAIYKMSLKVQQLVKCYSKRLVEINDAIVYFNETFWITLFTDWKMQISNSVQNPPPGETAPLEV